MAEFQGFSEIPFERVGFARADRIWLGQDVNILYTAQVAEKGTAIYFEQQIVTRDPQVRRGYSMFFGQVFMSKAAKYGYTEDLMAQKGIKYTWEQGEGGETYDWPRTLPMDYNYYKRTY